MVEVTIFTGGGVKIGQGLIDQAGLIEKIRTNASDHGRNSVKLTTLTVVELEDDSLLRVEERWRGEGVEISEVNTAAPPDVVDPTSDKRQGPTVLFLGLWLQDGGLKVGGNCSVLGIEHCQRNCVSDCC